MKAFKMPKLKRFSFSKKKNKTTTSRKFSLKRILTVFVSLFLIFALLASAGGLGYIYTTVQGAPTLNINDFIAADSSKVYDNQGALIADIGFQIRENISYDDLPQVVIDAFVSIEDSRFFEHNGFDLPRFMRATLENIRSLSFAQGGSTFTMQLVKGTYFETEEATAVRRGLDGVNRKIREIYVALQAEQVMSKRRILELYLNRINYGVPGNKRGIQTAAQYYFDKSVSELGLKEAAMLAGIINAPNLFNPMRNFEESNRRTNIVIDLMAYHGYITRAEAELARAIPLENILVGNTRPGIAFPYQAFIDATIQEVRELTGIDPVDVPMRIYTTMDRQIQASIEAIQNGENASVQWPNDIIQTAMITMNNKTGEILGIGGGRFYNGERLLNRATNMVRQPGSSVKTLFTYPLAFEHLGWSTQHMIEDRPIQYAGTDIIVRNFDNVYRGDVLLPEAIASSLNIPAIQTLQSVVNTIGSRRVVEYLNSAGFNQVTTNQFDIGYSIGGSSFEVSPYQLMGAQAAMVNGGNFIKPHLVTRIEFLDGSPPITPSYSSTRILSEEAAFMTSMMTQYNVEGPFFNFMQILRRPFPVYAKTGTSDWGETGIPFGIPAGAAKDKWLLSSTSDVSTAVWVGYDRAVAGQVSHMDRQQINLNLPGRISSELLNAIYRSRPNPAPIPRPSNVVDLTHIIGIYPYVAPNSSTNPDLIRTGLIKAEYANLSTLPTPSIFSPSSLTGSATASGSNTTFTLTMSIYPEPDALSVASNEKYFFLQVGERIVEATGRRLFDFSWIYGPIRYKVRISIDGSVIEVLRSDSNVLSTTLAVSPSSVVQACGYFGYDFVDFNSSELCMTFDMKELFIQIPRLIGQPLSTLNTFITNYQLEANKFPIVNENPNALSNLNHLGRIHRLSVENFDNKTVKIEDKSTLATTVYVLNDLEVNISNMINQTTLPAFCQYGSSNPSNTTPLCGLAEGSPSSGTIEKVFLGNQDVSALNLRLSQIISGGGLKIQRQAVTPPPSTTP
jgi:penicillin-binding protein 1A